jgi:hypothetical protein
MPGMALTPVPGSVVPARKCEGDGRWLVAGGQLKQKTISVFDSLATSHSALSIPYRPTAYCFKGRVLFDNHFHFWKLKLPDTSASAGSIGGP